MAPLILAIAHDAGPSRALQLLTAYLAREGFSTDFCLLFGGAVAPYSDDSLREKINAADFVVIGMSSNEKNAYIEVLATKICIELNKPFALFSDTFLVWGRPHFAHARTAAAALFVVNTFEQERARVLFPTTTIVDTGNPNWGGFFAPADKRVSRERMNAYDDERVTFAPGNKSPQENIVDWSAIIRASAQFKRQHVVLSLHPGDHTDRSEYGCVLRLANECGVRTTLLEEKGNADSYVPGADIVFNGSSVLAHAIARCIPVIEFRTGAAQDRLERESGSRFGYFHGTGVVFDAYDVQWQNLVPYLQILEDNPNFLRTKQQDVLVARNADQCCELMAKAIRHIL